MRHYPRLLALAETDHRLTSPTLTIRVSARARIRALRVLALYEARYGAAEPRDTSTPALVREALAVLGFDADAVWSWTETGPEDGTVYRPVGCSWSAAAEELRRLRGLPPRRLSPAEGWSDERVQGALDGALDAYEEG